MIFYYLGVLFSFFFFFFPQKLLYILFLFETVLREVVAQEVLSDIPIRHNSSLLGCAFFFSVDTLRTLLLLHSVIALGNLNAMKVIESWGDRSQVAIFNYQKQSGHGYFNEQ